MAGRVEEIVARSGKRAPFLFGAQGTHQAPQGPSVRESVQRVAEAAALRQEAVAAGELVQRLDHGGGGSTAPVATANEAVTTISTAYGGVLGAVQEHNRALQQDVAQAKEDAANAYAAGESAASEMARIALGAVEKANEGAVAAITKMGEQALSFAKEAKDMIVAVKDNQLQQKDAVIAALGGQVTQLKTEVDQLKQGGGLAGIGPGNPLAALGQKALETTLNRVVEDMNMTDEQRLEKAKKLAGAQAAPAQTITPEQAWAWDRVFHRRRVDDQQIRHEDEAHQDQRARHQELTGAFGKIPDFAEKWLPRVLGGAPATGEHNGIPDRW